VALNIRGGGLQEGESVKDAHVYSQVQVSPDEREKCKLLGSSLGEQGSIIPTVGKERGERKHHGETLNSKSARIFTP